MRSVADEGFGDSNREVNLVSTEFQEGFPIDFAGVAQGDQFPHQDTGEFRVVVPVVGAWDFHFRKLFKIPRTTMAMSVYRIWRLQSEIE